MMSANKIEYTEENSSIIITISGDITGDTELPLLSLYKELPEKSGKNIVINMSESEYINSAGIAALIALLNEVTDKGGKLALSHLNSHFKKVIETVGLDDFIQIFNSDSESFK